MDCANLTNFGCCATLMKPYSCIEDLYYIFLFSEFGEDDPELLKDALKRFAHSCAGYTVASYVLVSINFLLFIAIIIIILLI